VTYLLIAVTGCAADLFTKDWIFRWRGLPRAGNEWWLIDGHVGIQTSVNRGALFGMGEGYSWLFATLSIVSAIGILTWLFVFQAARDRWINVALGCVTGGILGNLYDRLGLWDATGLRPEFEHGVRDWILLRYSDEWTWPNFNIADSLLVTGAIMLVVHAFVWRDGTEKGKESGDEAQGTGKGRE
jgi:signal peptidase II